MGTVAPTRSLGLHTRVQMGSSAGLCQEGSEVGRQGQGCRRPQTKVAWCGLASGLAGPPDTGLGPGWSEAGGLLACDLRAPVHPLGAPRPSPGAEQATRSTSMMVLAGTPRLPRAPPPVTEKREAVTCLPQPCRHPGQETPPHQLWEGFLTPKCSPEAGDLCPWPPGPGAGVWSLWVNKAPAPHEPLADMPHRAGRAPRLRGQRPGPRAREDEV